MINGVCKKDAIYKVRHDSEDGVPCLVCDDCVKEYKKEGFIIKTISQNEVKK